MEQNETKTATQDVTAAAAVTETPETPETQQPESVSFTLEEWEGEIARAEQRGYERGLNASMAQEMARPEYFENPRLKEPSAGDDDDSPAILRCIRPSVWDR